ncbi:HD domain-containing protein [Zavarzinia sp. CC-PAN008]|uniref:HD domain-containing protein n=1 Tax=Zavarzinia sp. CC-PAN008 TaxID=3243332 RepID=UPI003F74ABC9
MLTDRFADALTFAEGLHRQQTRKGNDIPYVAHLMTVAASVLEHGGDEETAIAALLHDAAEDQGGMPTLERIAARFGPKVAAIVEACSDSLTEDPTAKKPWFERKQAHVAHMRDVDAATALVMACDKLHNAQSMLRDIRRDGPATLARFNAGPQQILWYFRSVADALSRHGPAVPTADLLRTADAIEALVAEHQQPAAL